MTQVREERSRVRLKGDRDEAEVLLRGSLYNPSDPCKKLIRVVECGTIRDLTGQLVADYRSGAGSIYTLAEKYKVHRHTISAALKGHGITLGRTSMSDTEVERARTLQAQGLSWNAIGKTIGRDPKTVKAACTSPTPVESKRPKPRVMPTDLHEPVVPTPPSSIGRP